MRYVYNLQDSGDTTSEESSSAESDHSWDSDEDGSLASSSSNPRWKRQGSPSNSNSNRVNGSSRRKESAAAKKRTRMSLLTGRYFDVPDPSSMSIQEESGYDSEHGYGIAPESGALTNGIGGGGGKRRFFMSIPPENGWDSVMGGGGGVDEAVDMRRGVINGYHAGVNGKLPHSSHDFGGLFESVAGDGEADGDDGEEEDEGRMAVD